MKFATAALVIPVSVICSVSLYADEKVAKDQITADVLSRIASGISAAYESILFVKAEYSVKEERLVSPQNVPVVLRESAHGGAVHIHGDSMMRFSFDRRAHRVAQELQQIKPPTLVSIAEGKEIGTLPSPSHLRFMITSDGFFQRDLVNDDFGQVEGFPDVKGLKSDRGTLAVVESPKNATRYMSVCFDPNYWFSMDTLMFHVAYQRWAEILKTRMPIKSYEGFSQVLSTDVTGEETAGKVLVKEFRTGKYADSRGDVTIVTTHSRANSFLPVAYEFRIGNVVVRQKSWKWKQYEGVYLPEEYFEKVCSASDGTLGWSLDMKYKDAKINGEIEAEFDVVVALGLSAGDRVHDTVKGTLGVVGRSGEILGVEQYNAAYLKSPIALSASVEKEVAPRIWLLWANLAVLLCGVVYAVLRYRRKNPKL